MLDLSPETEALAVSLAEARRVSVDIAVRGALEAQAGLAAINNGPEDAALPAGLVARRSAVLRFYASEIAKLPDLDTRSVKEITDDLNPL